MSNREVDLLKIHTRIFSELIQEKNSWGKNEIAGVYQRSTTLALMEYIEITGAKKNNE